MLARMIAKRTAWGLLAAVLVSIVIFLGTRVLPGDAAEIRLGQTATPETLAALREQMGLDRPLLLQYLLWLKGFFSGDLGVSIGSNSLVSDLIAARYFNTVAVTVLTALLAIPVSLAFGLIAAMFPGSLLDRAITLMSVSLVAFPDFLVAALVVLLFVHTLGLNSAVVLEPSGTMGFGEMLKHYALPVLTLSIVVSAQMIRMTRAAVLNELTQPYIEMAILKGLPRGHIILVHALPNAVGAIVNVVALTLSYLISGVVVIEVFFGYQGLAVLMVQGVQTRDFAVVQSIGMIFCLIYVALMLLADIGAMIANPKLRYPR